MTPESMTTAEIEQAYDAHAKEPECLVPNKLKKNHIMMFDGKTGELFVKPPGLSPMHYIAKGFTLRPDKAKYQAFLDDRAKLHAKQAQAREEAEEIENVIQEEERNEQTKQIQKARKSISARKKRTLEGKD